MRPVTGVDPRSGDNPGAWRRLWPREATTPDGTLYSHTGPAAYDDVAVARWLSRGCSGPSPADQGFAAVLLAADGSLRGASSARTEASLFWTTRSGTLLLAPHPRDLIGLLAVPPALDVGKLADLVVLHDDPVRTVWTGVYRLPTGHQLRWRPGGSAPSVRPWFTPDDAPDRSIGAAQAVALMRAAVTAAVAGSLPDRGDVHTTLSGGLDSSMVSIAAAALLQPQGRTVHAMTHVPLPGTAAVAGWEADDGPYARRLCAEVPGFTWSALTNTARRSPFASLAERFERTWLPTLNPSNTVWVHEALRRASAARSRLLLTGATGNGPYSPGAGPFLAELARRHRYDQLARFGAQGLRRGDGSALRLAAWAAAPPAVRAVRAHRRRGTSPRPNAGVEELLVRPELLSDGAAAARERAAGSEAPTRQDWVDLVRRDTSLAAGTQLLADDVWWSDPLSDPAVCTLALRLPAEAWLVGGRPRGLAREVSKGVVPDHVRLRTSRGGQSLDRGQWLAGREPEVLALLEQVEGCAAASEFLDLARLRRGVESLDPASPAVHRWEMGTGRALGFGLYAAWYESTVLARSR